MAMFIPDAQKVLMLDTHVTENVDAPKVALFTNGDLNVNGAIAIGDLVPPTGAWHVPSVITFNDVYRSGDGKFSRTAGSVQFDFEGEEGEESVQIWGYYVYQDASPDVLVGVEKYDSAVEMNSTLSAHIVAPQLEI